MFMNAVLMLLLLEFAKCYSFECSSEFFSCKISKNCIPLNQRCDGKMDCSDKNDDSDEVNCQLLDLPRTYNKDYQPENSKIQVNVSLHLKNVFDVNEVSMEFKARILVEMEWFDSRLEYKNLQDLNLVNPALGSELWKPILLFFNSNQGERIKFDPEALVTIEKKSKVAEISEENYLYSGSENSLKMSKYETVTLQCNYQMFKYPFDIQSCPIILTVPLQLKSQMKIFLRQKPTKDPISFLQYQLRDLEVSNSTKEKIQIDIKLERMFSNHLLTIFLPTICLIIIAEMMLFVNSEHFEASIMVSLTSMLVMYSLYQRISSELPKTAYIKMMDIWLQGGLFLPFAVFVLLVIAKNCPKKDKNIMFISRILVPFSTLAFFFIYFTVVAFI